MGQRYAPKDVRVDACSLCGRSFGFVTSSVTRSYQRELEHHGWDYVTTRRGQIWLLACRRCLEPYRDAEAVYAATPATPQ